MRPGQRVPELWPLFEILYILISCDKVGIGGIVIMISDNSSLDWLSVKWRSMICVEFFIEDYIKAFWISFYSNVMECLLNDCLFLHLFSQSQ